VEELPAIANGAARKLLFVSAKQADLIASDTESLTKLLISGFEVPPDSGLVVNLLPSMEMRDIGDPKERFKGN
jgi:hypothetical protein